MQTLDFIRAHLLALPSLTKFALILGIIAGVPALSRRLRLPAAVGLLFAGLVIGPHGIGLFGEQRPIADFFAELGKVLLMFMAGLEGNLTLFKAAKNKVMIFGALTKESLKGLLDLSTREKVIIYPLVLLVIFFGVYPAPIFDATAESVKTLVTNVTASIGTAQTAAAN